MNTLFDESETINIADFVFQQPFFKKIIGGRSRYGKRTHRTKRANYRSFENLRTVLHASANRPSERVVGKHKRVGSREKHEKLF